jgi:hypothetical protein
MNDVFHREIVDFEMVLQKLKFVLLGRVAVEPQISIAPPQQINCNVSANSLEVVCFGMSDC